MALSDDFPATMTGFKGLSTVACDYGRQSNKDSGLGVEPFFFLKTLSRPLYRSTLALLCNTLFIVFAFISAFEDPL